MLTTNSSESPDIYGLQASPYERYLLLAWSVLILTICLPGNCLVLVASIKYKAIKLDNISVILIRHIAVADMIHAVSTVLSSIPALVTDRWVLGQFLCDATPTGFYISGTASTEMICALNISKLTCLLDPLRSITRTKKKGHVIAIILWVWAVISEALIVATFMLQYRFHPSSFRCDYTVDDIVAERGMNVVIVVFLLLPVLVVVTTTVWLACFVGSVRGLHGQGVVTLVLISSVYFVSYAPLGIYSLVMAASSVEYQVYADYYVYFYRFALFVVHLNVAANPFIYFVSIASFKEFVKSAWQRRTRTVYIPLVRAGRPATNTQ